MTRRCRRTSCSRLLDDESEPYCGDTCRRIDDAMAAVPHASGAVARMGRGACVAEAFDWMDSRARREAS